MVNLIFLATLVIPNRDLPHQVNVCTEKVVKMKRDKNVTLFLRNFAHCAIMILIMLQQYFRNGFQIFLYSYLNLYTLDYFMFSIKSSINFQLVKVMLLQFRFFWSQQNVSIKSTGRFCQIVLERIFLFFGQSISNIICRFKKRFGCIM